MHMRLGVRGNVVASMLLLVVMAGCEQSAGPRALMMPKDKDWVSPERAYTLSLLPAAEEFGREWSEVDRAVVAHSHYGRKDVWYAAGVPPLALQAEINAALSQPGAQRIWMGAIFGDPGTSAQADLIVSYSFERYPALPLPGIHRLPKDDGWIWTHGLDGIAEGVKSSDLPVEAVESSGNPPAETNAPVVTADTPETNEGEADATSSAAAAQTGTTVDADATVASMYSGSFVVADGNRASGDTTSSGDASTSSAVSVQADTAEPMAAPDATVPVATAMALESGEGTNGTTVSVEKNEAAGANPLPDKASPPHSAFTTHVLLADGVRVKVRCRVGMPSETMESVRKTVRSRLAQALAREKALRDEVELDRHKTDVSLDVPAREGLLERVGKRIGDGKVDVFQRKF